MKNILLYRLRKNYVINKRNNEYQLISLDGRYKALRGWTTLEDCLKNRRDYILSDARQWYKKPKSRLKLTN